MTTNQDGPNTAGAAEPVAWMYETADGERTFEFNPNGDSARWLIENGYTETPLYAHPPENPPKRPSVVPDDIEVLLSAVENGELTNVDRHLNARMCCDGHMCGCRGSTVGEYLAYELRAALTASLPAIRAQAVAEIAADIRATMCDCSGKFIADTIEQDIHNSHHKP